MTKNWNKTYNQNGFNLENARKMELNAEDLMILRWFLDFYPLMERVCVDNKEYGWVHYGYLLHNLQIIYCKEESVAKRFHRYCELGLIEKTVKNTKQGRKVYFRAVENIILLYTSHTDKNLDAHTDKNLDAHTDKNLDNSSTIYPSTINSNKDTASGFSESDFLENFIQKHLSKMSESEKAGFQTFAVTQLEQVSEKLGRLLTQEECLEHCKKILNVMYPQNENPTVKDSLTVQKPKKEVEVEIIPNCIDISKWEEWKNYKKEKKQKLTKSTAEKQLQNLQKWHLEGQDPNEIIDNSISNGWQGLFPLKQEKSNQSTFNNQYAKPKPDYLEVQKRYAATGELQLSTTYRKRRD